MSIAKKSLIGALLVSAIAIFATAIIVATASYKTADSVIREQSKDRLVSIREVQKEEIQLYLESIRKQVVVQSASMATQDAAKRFIGAFHDFSATAPPLSTDKMRSELSQYYTQEYGKLYQKKNNDDSFSADSLLTRIDDKATALQYHFIQKNPNALGAKDELDKLAFDSPYSDTHSRYHPEFRRFLRAFNYYDIFIVDAKTGHIVYSVYKELDFGTSLLDGPYRRSGLADVFKQLRYATKPDATAYSAFRSYTPSYEDPAAFIGSPITDENGETIAVMAFQMPIDELNKMMTHDQRWSEKGLGASGETYLVGENYLAQSISRFLIEDKEGYAQALREVGVDGELLDKILNKETNIGFQEIKTPGVQAALSGESGFAIFPDYRGVPVLSAYTGIEFEGSKLALLVEIDEAEAFAFADTMITQNSIITIVIGLSVLGLVALIVWRFTSTLSGQLNQAVSIADAVSRGDKATITVPDNKDEIRDLMIALDRMQTELIGELELRERESSRIKSALDVCDTNVMMADTDLNIIYMNESVVTMMNDAESDMKKDLPDFDSGKLMGENIDVFHKNPGHQRQLLATLQDVYRAEIMVGGRTFGLTATPIVAEGGERLGTVVEWDDKTERIAKERSERVISEENARIRTALDKVSANVMMADVDRTIIYTNEAVIDTLRNAQDDIRKDLPNFDVDTLLGGSIDQFHKNPQHQMQMLDTLSGVHSADIIVGGRHMTLVLSPVTDDEGVRIGTVVEWADRTAEVRIQQEMDMIIAAANDGDLSERIGLEDKTGSFLRLSEGLNTLLNKVASFVQDMSGLFQSMSEGDLTKTVKNEYRGEFEEIKNNANNTLLKLTEVMGKIQSTSASVRTSANEVAQGSDDLSRRTESQASSLEETASSMEEMTATVKQTSENASQADVLAGEAKAKAQQGGAVVKDAVNAMSEILDSSNKINDIIGVIDEIAFQTNLLALNAAVEAARAGEQGRGFAVVAGEVRTLSQRSAAAAKEIKDLIRDSVGKVESGSTLVNQSGETLAEIVGAVDRVAMMIQDVNNASSEQNSGISQINQAVTQMDEMTQKNAALVEETSAASRSMSEEATNMNSLIAFFKLNANIANEVSVTTRAESVSRASEPAVPTSAPADASSNSVSSYIDDIYK